MEGKNKSMSAGPREDMQTYSKDIYDITMELWDYVSAFEALGVVPKYDSIVSRSEE